MLTKKRDVFHLEKKKLQVAFCFLQQSIAERSNDRILSK